MKLSSLRNNDYHDLKLLKHYTMFKMEILYAHIQIYLCIIYVIFWQKIFFIRVNTNIVNLTILIFNDVKFEGRKIPSQ